MNINLKELEKQFHADGYRLGMKAVGNGFSKDALFDAVKNLHQMVDELVNSFSEFAERQNLKPACKKGCHWCCHQPVFALDYELDYLRDFISENFDSSTQKQMSARVAEKRKKLENLIGESLLNSKFPCPLLDKGTCLAYSARPVACRIYLSSNLESCLKFYHEPENENSVPALLQLPMRLGRMLNEGFKAALKTSGVKVEEFRIEEKISN
ncbi:MAG: YkgJ family cysteine cluster protein [Mariniphaga sp.]|nr:YkgJ family cysteine cluster protein [Mariniphaga sp.]